MKITIKLTQDQYGSDKDYDFSVFDGKLNSGWLSVSLRDEEYDTTVTEMRNFAKAVLALCDEKTET